MTTTSTVGALNVLLGVDTSVFRDRLNQAVQQLGRVGADMQRVGRQLTVGLSAPIAGFAALSLRTAGEFESAMNRIGAATGASAEDMASLHELARELGQTTKFSATEAADAIEQLAKNGVSTADILGGTLKASLDLAA